MDKNYVITRMSGAELELAIDWARDEGWNPGLHDASCFHAADPHGFFVGKLDNNAIAVASAVAYDENFSFFGLYIVDPVYRGHGYGLVLTHACLTYLGTRVVGLDGVVKMTDKYEQLGFTTAHYNARYEIQSHLIPCTTLSMPVISLKNVPFSMLKLYDRQHFQAPRDVFLKRWVTQPGVKTAAIIQAGALCGYGVMRPCHHGFKIGPLFADTPSIANTLFLHLIAHAAGKKVYLDSPTNNPNAMALVNDHGLKQVFETVRMYLRDEPEIKIEQIYGITSFELG
jgi:GNAT superfamily N-acetyltransferase